MSFAKKSKTKTDQEPSFTHAYAGFLQRKKGNVCMEEECRKKRRLLQRKKANNKQFSEIPPIITDLLHSSDQPLNTSVSAFLDSRFAHDFGRVHVFNNTSRRSSPQKALGEGGPEEDREEKPSPKQGGDATIQCDGSGGYEVVLNGYQNATCGTKDCVIIHENSHIADWKAKWPTGCNGQPKGYLPKGDPPDKPLMTVAEYNDFLKKSECKAHTADLDCANKLPKTGACKKTVEDYIKLTKSQKAKWCPSSAWIWALIGGIAAAGLIGGLLGGLL